MSHHPTQRPEADRSIRPPRRRRWWRWILAGLLALVVIWPEFAVRQAGPVRATSRATRRNGDRARRPP